MLLKRWCSKTNVTGEDIDKMIQRSLAELQKAILKYRVLQKLDPETQVEIFNSPVNFFYLVFLALRQDIWWHSFRVFDTHRDAKAWKFLRKTLRAEFKGATKKVGVSVTRIRKLSSKLLPIRNWTMAHIDLKSIRNPKDPYGVADMKWRELDELLESSFAVLSAVCEARGGEPPPLDVYDAEDVHKIIEAYIKSDPAALITLRDRREST